MLILAIDTSTSAIAVGLTDAEGLTTSNSRLDARGHTEHLAPLVSGVLANAGLSPASITDIVVGTGPGPFTGLRVGLVTALTMGHALGVPVHGICSLDVLATQLEVPPASEVLVATDARRREVYWAHYRVGEELRRLAGPAVNLPGEVPGALRSLPTAGRGPLLHPDALTHPAGPLDVDAVALAELGATGIRQGWEMPVEPLYLRRPDALTTAERGAR